MTGLSLLIFLHSVQQPGKFNMAYSWWQRVRLVSWLGLILAFTVIPPVVFPLTGLAQVQSSGVTVTPDQINALRYHANVFMGNAKLESLPSETLRLKGPGTIEFWVSPLWDTPLDEDAYVLSCDAGGRTLYSVFFREEDEMLYLGFDCGDGDPRAL
jgi:hypothetical protein